MIQTLIHLIYAAKDKNVNRFFQILGLNSLETINLSIQTMDKAEQKEIPN